MNIQQRIFVSILVALVPTIAIIRSTGGVSEPQIACRAFGGVSEQVCPASFVKLLANPEIFSEKTIAVRGWPKKLHGTFYLFLDKAAADNDMMENALVCASGCSRIESRIGVKTTLIGVFTTKVRRDDLFTPVGAINVKLIREID